MHIHSAPLFEFTPPPPAKSTAANTSSTSVLDATMTALADVYGAGPTRSRAGWQSSLSSGSLPSEPSVENEPPALGYAGAISAQYDSGASLADSAAVKGTLIDTFA